ncbi:MAG: MBL fold metallo-hydrolase [Phycisphaerae bacterium]|nr:MBL fold metallo-hydrolase [Phycisphaerae bacterium]
MAALQVRVNGIHAAWPAFLGSSDPHGEEVRRTDPYRVANTSFSLLQWEGETLVRHTLIDIGLGVMQSLLEFEAQRGVHVVHEVLITHPHFDHFAGLDWLAHSIALNEQAGQPRPLPIYATLQGWYIGPGRVFPYLTDKGRVEHVGVKPGEPFNLGGLRITPAAVQHSSSAPGAVAYVAEWLDTDGDGPKKIIVTGDFLNVADENDPLWKGADVCFMESLTWNPNPEAGHQCVLDGLRRIKKWAPRRTYLVHYSGFDDLKHQQSAVRSSLTYDELASAVDVAKGDLDVRVARHGMVLPDDEPWPT